ncbi:MAG TPA: DUF5995 family protein [Candidatus Acidoferrales bacterium]|nr:DUF5995 family protein [Candidatus Acidoferrales bacterium]
MFPYDPALLAAVTSPPASIDDVVRAMEAIDAACVDTDGLKWFNWLYLEVTRAVEARVAAGGFQDPAWLAVLDVRFAALYFGALKARLSDEGSVPECWQVLFDRRSQSAIARIQFALAGMNAHINRDLSVALVAMGSAPVHGGEHYMDYTAVNTTLDALVDTARQTLNVRLPGDKLPEVSRLEDTIAAFSLSAARENAWNKAEVLWSLGGLPDLRARTMQAEDGLAAVIGKALLVPAPWS